MDVEKVLEGLSDALPRQFRSATAFTLAAGSMTGLEGQALADHFRSFGETSLDDARRLVEKLVALGGSANVDAAKLDWPSDLDGRLRWLVDAETELMGILKDLITVSGQEPRSEALEHLLEHVILRKQDQIDLLLRVARG